jgi:hypothetical protein
LIFFRLPRIQRDFTSFYFQTGKDSQAGGGLGWNIFVKEAWREEAKEI